jgi:hypothetical protein
MTNISQIRRNSSASRIGVTGPAGRRLSLQHDILDDGKCFIVIMSFRKGKYKGFCVTILEVIDKLYFIMLYTLP